MAKRRLAYTTLLLPLNLEHGLVSAAGAGRIRQRKPSPAPIDSSSGTSSGVSSSLSSIQGVGLRGSSSFIRSPPSPTLNPTTLHPTTKAWAAGYQTTDYPTSSPSMLPTYDHHSDYPTFAHSSYVPTDEFLFADSVVRSGNLDDNKDTANVDGGDRNARSANDATSSEDCGPNAQLFQLDLHTDYYSCETSWTLEQIFSTSEAIVIDSHDGYYYDTHYTGADSRCLDAGEYKFTIYDAFGDGMQSPGYYLLALDGEIFAGSSDFGYEEVTTFSVNDSSTATISMAGVDEPASDVVSVDIMASTSLMNENEMETGYKNDNAKPSGLERPVEVQSNLERPSPEVSPSINPPTSSPTNSQPNDSSILISKESSSDDNDDEYSWIELLSDDFLESSYPSTTFHPGGSTNDHHVTYYPYVKDRRGIYRMQHGLGMSSSIYSDNISLLSGVDAALTNIENDVSEKEIRVVFSYYANSMESTDGFCLDTSTDDATSWHSQNCWHSQQDFGNGIWYDDVSFSFRLKQQPQQWHDSNNSFRIRFRCKGNSELDDILMDKVEVLQKRKTRSNGHLYSEEERDDGRLTELKDSKS